MKIYVTFGQTHAHSVNGKTLDKDCVAVFEETDGENGRVMAHKMFKGKFCMLYTENNWDCNCLEYYPRGLIHV